MCTCDTVAMYFLILVVVIRSGFFKSTLFVIHLRESQHFKCPDLDDGAANRKGFSRGTPMAFLLLLSTSNASLMSLVSKTGTFLFFFPTISTSCSLNPPQKQKNIQYAFNFTLCCRTVRQMIVVKNMPKLF